MLYKVKTPARHAEAALPPAVSELPHGASVHEGPARLPVSNENGMFTHNNNLNPDTNRNPISGTDPGPNSSR